MQKYDKYNFNADSPFSLGMSTFTQNKNLHLMSNKEQTLSFSPLIIGTMRLGKWGVKMDSKQLEQFIDACLDLGLRDFDHADIYGDYTEEAAFGAVLQKRPDLRNKLQLTTKCGIKMVTPNRPDHRIKSYDSGKAHILSSVEKSLKALHTDYLDLFLLHRPDFLMHPQEVAEAFEQLKKEGKVRYFGVSNFSTSQLDMLLQFTPLVNHQLEISLSHLSPFKDGKLDQCLQNGITPTAWSPYGGGSLLKDTDNPILLSTQQTAKNLARKYDATIDQIMLAFLLRHPAGIIPVLGTSKITRIQSALNAVSIKLSREDWYELWQSATGVEVP